MSNTTKNTDNNKLKTNSSYGKEESKEGGEKGT